MFSHVSKLRSVLMAAGCGTALCLPSFVTAQQTEVAPRATQPAQREAPPADARAVRNLDAQQLTEYFADQLMLCNEGEIALSKIAEERSKNNDVKQLAKMLIDDHTQLDAKLKQIAPKAAENFAERRRMAGDLAARIGKSIRDRVNDRAIPAEDRVQIRTAAREAGEHDAFTKLCQINHNAARNHQDASKRLLEQYTGQDFDMAFLGMQIGSHTWLLSELQALHGVGTPEFQEIVTSATQSVEHHLQQAKDLAKKLEGNRRAS